jgi:hypothetical protein
MFFPLVFALYGGRYVVLGQAGTSLAYAVLLPLATNCKGVQISEADIKVGNEWNEFTR